MIHQTIFTAGLFSIAASGLSQTKPNILLILSDDHSVPQLGCYGNPDLKTPNLDWLAKEGIRFNRMYTTSPQSAPSRKSILTGRSSIDLGVSRFTAPLPRDVITLPEKLRDAGYYTGFLGRMHHTDGPGKLTGISEQVFNEYNLRVAQDRVDHPISGRGDERNTELFEEFLNAVPAGKSFFLQLSYSDPHRAWTASAFEPDPNKLHVPTRFPDTPLVRKDLAMCYGEIQRLDHNIGKVWEILRNREILDNTIIIFMGDNGVALLRGKGSLFELGINVPFLIRWPGFIKADIVSDAILSAEDILPTLIEIAGAEMPEKVTGISFLPVLKGEKTSVREYAFAARSAHSSALPGSNGAFDQIRCVVGARYKLIYNALWNLPEYTPMADSHHKTDIARQMLNDLKNRQKAGTLPEKFNILFKTPRPIFEFYDLVHDPDEFNNLIDNTKYETEIIKLKEVLQRQMILNWDYLPLPVIDQD